MIAYLLMGVFAVQTTDSKEGFRRFNNFHTQAVAVNLSRWSEKHEAGMIYDLELWPEVSNLIMFEMAKRAWSVFKSYSNNLCLELARRPHFQDIEVERPKPVEDSYLRLNSYSIDEYAKAPNPITFILSLQDLAAIVETYSELVFGRVQEAVFRYGQLAKFREIQEKVVAWERNIPSFLDWKNTVNDRPPRNWMRLQRDYLESQYQCILMKISWSTASLGPVLIAKLQSIWENGDPYAEARNAAKRVLDIAKESASTTNSRAFHHSNAVRATTLLLQTLLRESQQDHQEKKNQVTEACREAIALCRSLVPAALAKAEDTIEGLLKGYISRAALAPPPPGQPLQFRKDFTATAIGSPASQNAFIDSFGAPFSFPFDTVPMDLFFPTSGYSLSTTNWIP